MGRHRCSWADRSSPSGSGSCSVREASRPTRGAVPVGDGLSLGGSRELLEALVRAPSAGDPPACTATRRMGADAGRAGGRRRRVGAARARGQRSVFDVPLEQRWDSGCAGSGSSRGLLVGAALARLHLRPYVFLTYERPFSIHPFRASSGACQGALLQRRHAAVAGSARGAPRKERKRCPSHRRRRRRSS